jgi:hypothetical protein
MKEIGVLTIERMINWSCRGQGGLSTCNSAVSFDPKVIPNTREDNACYEEGVEPMPQKIDTTPPVPQDPPRWNVPEGEEDVEDSWQWINDH